MAKKGKKSQPVAMKKGDSNVIRIERELWKPRMTRKSGGGRHQTREDDVRRGRSRKPKHKGRADW